MHHYKAENGFTGSDGYDNEKKIMQKKLIFISDHLSEYHEFLKKEPDFGSTMEMMGHAEANRRHIYQNYYDLFIVDLKQNWLAIPPWVYEQANHQYYFQFVFLSDKPLSEEVNNLLNIRISKVIDRETAKAHLPEILEELNSATSSHHFSFVKSNLNTFNSISSLIGGNQSIKNINKFIDIVGKTQSAPCLIRGDLGTGKNLCAALIHQKNNLSLEHFHKKNCEGATTNEFMGDLFGVDETSEIYGPARMGLLEKYSNGTLVLTNIEKMPLEVQNKLLLFLEGRVFMVPGSKRVVESKTRVIGITRHDLEWFVRHQNYNSGLYYRLKAFEVVMPSLKERRDDIEKLSNYYLQYYNNQLGKELKAISPVALQMMREYNWPGNVTELKNIIERAVIISKGDQIMAEDFPDNLQNDLSSLQSSEYLGNCSLKELERIHIHHVLLRTKGNKSKAAEILDISRTTLREKMRIYSVNA